MVKFTNKGEHVSDMCSVPLKRAEEIIKIMQELRKKHKSIVKFLSEFQKVAKLEGEAEYLFVGLLIGKNARVVSIEMSL